MMKKVTESLAGRAGIVRILGLSNSEINGNDFLPFEVEPKELVSRLNSFKRMTMPEIFKRGLDDIIAVQEQRIDTLNKTLTDLKKLNEQLN